MEDSVGTTSQEEPSQATEVDSVSVEEPAPAADYADKKVKTEAKKPIKGQSEAIKRKKDAQRDNYLALIRQIMANPDMTLAWFGEIKNPPMSKSEAVTRLASFFEMYQSREQASVPSVEGQTATLDGTMREDGSDNTAEGRWTDKRIRSVLERLKKKQADCAQRGMLAHWKSWPEVERADPIKKNELFKYHEYYFDIRKIQSRAAELSVGYINANKPFVRQPSGSISLTPDASSSRSTVGTTSSTNAPSFPESDTKPSLSGLRPSMSATVDDPEVIIISDSDDASDHGGPTAPLKKPKASSAPLRGDDGSGDDNTGRKRVRTGLAESTPPSNKPRHNVSAPPSSSSASRRSGADEGGKTHGEDGGHASTEPVGGSTLLQEGLSAASTDDNTSTVPNSSRANVNKASIAAGPPQEQPSSATKGPVPTTLNPPVTPSSAAPHHTNATIRTPKVPLATPTLQAAERLAIDGSPAGIAYRPPDSSSNTAPRSTRGQESMQTGPAVNPVNPAITPAFAQSAPVIVPDRHRDVKPMRVQNWSGQRPSRWGSQPSALPPTPATPFARSRSWGTNPFSQPPSPSARFSPTPARSNTSASEYTPWFGSGDEPRVSARPQTDVGPMRHKAAPSAKHIILSHIDWSEYRNDAVLFSSFERDARHIPSIRSDIFGYAAVSNKCLTRPRWKVERDLYIAVQEADPFKAWINLAQSQQWIKWKDGQWVYLSGWDDTIVNPVRERLNHWRRRWEEAAARGQVDSFYVALTRKSLRESLKGRAWPDREGRRPRGSDQIHIAQSIVRNIQDATNAGTMMPGLDPTPTRENGDSDNVV